MAWALAKCNPPAPDLLSAIAARTVEVLCQAPPPDAPSIANRRPGSSGSTAFLLPAGGSRAGCRVQVAAAPRLSPLGGSRRVGLAAPDEEEDEDGETDDDGEDEDDETTGGSGAGGSAASAAATAEAMQAARAEVVSRAGAAGLLRFDSSAAGRPPQRQKV